VSRSTIDGTLTYVRAKFGAYAFVTVMDTAGGITALLGNIVMVHRAGPVSAFGGSGSDTARKNPSNISTPRVRIKYRFIILNACFFTQILPADREQMD
jgi:hypothetical protein